MSTSKDLLSFSGWGRRGSQDNLEAGSLKGMSLGKKEGQRDSV
jgi:hypothetical protein